jgi:hypothetical protein
MVVSVLPTHVIHPRMGWAKADATPVNTAMARSWGIIGGRPGPGERAGTVVLGYNALKDSEGAPFRP